MASRRRFGYYRLGIKQKATARVLLSIFRCVILGTMLIPGLAWSQTLRLTLEECIARAQVNHPRAGVATGQLNLQKSLLAQAKAAQRLPQFEATFLTGPVPGAEGSYLDPALHLDWGNLSVFTRLQVDAVQPLYTFGKLEGRKMAAQHAVEAAHEEQLQTAAEIRREVRKAYYGALLSREIIVVLNETLELLDKARSKVQAGLKTESGDFSPTDEYRLDLFASELQVRRIGLSSTREAALVKLKFSIGLPQSADLDVADTTLAEDIHGPVETGSVLGEAFRQRHDVQRLEAGERAREELAKSVRGDSFPQLFLATSLRAAWAPNRTEQQNPFIRDDFNFVRGVFGLGLRYSLNWSSQRAKMREAQSDLERTRAQRKLAETTLSVEAVGSASDVNTTGSIVQVRQEAVRRARAWLASENANFDLGVTETRNLLEAYDAHLRSRIALLQALHDHGLSWAEYQYASGSDP